MKTLDRIVLGLLAVVLGFISIMLLWGVFANSPLWSWLGAVQRSALDMGLLAVIVAAAAIYLGFMIWKGPEEEQAFLVHSTAMGQVRISYSTIKELVARAALGVDGIKEVQVQLAGEETVTVTLAVRLAPDFHIPTVTAAAQSHVRKYLEQTVGMEPVGVEVDVLGTAGAGRTRVQ